MRRWVPLLAVLALLVTAAPAAAETFTVTSTADGGGPCSGTSCPSIRSAVNAAVNTGEADRIFVPPGQYGLNSALQITTPVTIDGAGMGATRVFAASSSHEVFIIGAPVAVTISNLTMADGFGGWGGNLVNTGTLTLDHIRSTSGDASSGGGMANVGGTMTVTHSVIDGNESLRGGGDSGGIANINSNANLTVRHSTIAGNRSKVGGGIFAWGNPGSTDNITTRLEHVTVVGNQALEGAVGGVGNGVTVGFTVRASVIAGNTDVNGVSNCGANLPVSEGANVVATAECNFAAAGDVVADPQLGAFDGASYPLAVTSPAVDRAGACTGTDQRDLARPQGSACDSGAYEYTAATLRVVTTVINDSGGTRTPSQFSAHLTTAGNDVAGSPQPGTIHGTTYPAVPGSTYTVAAEAVAGYTLSVSGDCAADGSITLQEDENRICTITAGDVAPRLNVVTQVINDHGGSAVPGSFAVHVRRGGADVANSPQPGSSGTAYTLTPGTHVVSADAVSGYGSAVSGDCAGDGSITLDVGDDKTCTVTANDDPPPVQPQGSSQDPQPEFKETVVVDEVSGTVKVRLAGTNRFVALNDVRDIPMGSVIDARKGVVELVSVAREGGAPQTARFSEGIFRVSQSGAVTVLTLTEKLSCGTAGKASIAAKKTRKRRLWGDGKGRFRTKGEYSSATVRGTKWLVADTCKTTLTRVVRGKVTVRDFVKRKTVTVKAGGRYTARRKRR